MLAKRVPDLWGPNAASPMGTMARIAELIGALLRSATTPSPGTGIIVVPASRVLLMSVVFFLVVGILITIRLQFSRYEQARRVRWSAAACLAAVIVCGTAAIVCGVG